MSEPIKTKDLALFPLTPGIFVRVQPLITEYAGPAVSWDYLQGTIHFPDLCPTVMGNDDIYTAFYPSVYDRNDKHNLEINVVMFPIAFVRRQAHQDMLYQYINFIFSLGYNKVTAKVRESVKFIRLILEKRGFQLEGVSRQEYEGKEDIMYYGLLKGEWYGQKRT